MIGWVDRGWIGWVAIEWLVRWVRGVFSRAREAAPVSPDEPAVPVPKKERG